jgi:hypothetical protein
MKHFLKVDNEVILPIQPVHAPLSVYTPSTHKTHACPSWTCVCPLQSVHAPLRFVCQLLKHELAIVALTW